MRHALAGIVLLLAGAAMAQSVALTGAMGRRAMLVIDGQPQLLGVGESARGVRLLALDGDVARIELGGRELQLRLGGAPTRLGAGAGGGAPGREIVMTAGPGGHFLADGAINGRAVRFMVDTGATMVAMSLADARRLGIDYARGQRAVVGTANGPVAVWRVNLAAVRVGEVEVSNVDAVVGAGEMPFVLLGNSFLSRFSMRRDSDVMRLELR